MAARKALSARKDWIRWTGLAFLSGLPLFAGRHAGRPLRFCSGRVVGAQCCSVRAVGAALCGRPESSVCPERLDQMDGTGLPLRAAPFCGPPRRAAPTLLFRPGRRGTVLFRPGCRGGPMWPPGKLCLPGKIGSDGRDWPSSQGGPYASVLAARFSPQHMTRPRFGFPKWGIFQSIIIFINPCSRR